MEARSQPRRKLLDRRRDHTAYWKRSTPRCGLQQHPDHSSRALEHNHVADHPATGSEQFRSHLQPFYRPSGSSWITRIQIRGCGGLDPSAERSLPLHLGLRVKSQHGHEHRPEGRLDRRPQFLRGRDASDRQPILHGPPTGSGCAIRRTG